MPPTTEAIISSSGPLLGADGRPTQIGWAPQPVLDCNLEAARFYALRPLQRFRLKRWDYYALFTPNRFFSATIADLGYAGNIFVYTLNFETHELHEEGLVIPFSKGITLPRNSTEGCSSFSNAVARLEFDVTPAGRTVFVDWPAFHAGLGIHAEFTLQSQPDHESMNIVIPIGQRRFYYNRKINCLPASGFLKYGSEREELLPQSTLGSLDWGRGVWDYRSFWQWASASSRLPDGRTVGLNLGGGFGDTSQAAENALILDGRIHKMGAVKIEYTPGDYMHPWRFQDAEGRLRLDFIPFKERLARTNLGLIFSEVHQMFGRYIGKVISNEGETIHLDGIIGFAEEHHARW